MCANFVGLREGEVALVGLLIYIRYRCLGKLLQAILTRRCNINRPILHLCFPSGPDEQLQSLSTDVKRIEKMNNNGEKIYVCKNKSV